MPLVLTIASGIILLFAGTIIGWKLLIYNLNQGGYRVLYIEDENKHWHFFTVYTGREPLNADQKAMLNSKHIKESI